MDVTRRLILIGSLLLLTLVTGFGKAWHLPLSGVHKLIALAWVVLLAILVYHSGRQIASGAVFFTVMAVLGVSIIALFWSGSVLTTPKFDPTVWLALHRIATALAVIATAILARLFMVKKP